MLKELGLLVSDQSRPVPGDPESLRRLTDLARTAEESGFSSLWVADWPTGPPDPDAPAEAFDLEAYTLLGALAVTTSSIRLGAIGTATGQRSPALLAKQVTALDVVSSGRALLGLGTGGEPPRASESLDDDMGRARGEALEESIEICKEMFTRDPVHFEGGYFSVAGATNRPAPVQVGGPPVFVYLAAGADRQRSILDVVARFADACMFEASAETVSGIVEGIDASCLRVGRAVSEISKILVSSSEKTADSLGECLRAGLDGLILETNQVTDTDLESLARELLGADSG